MKRITDAGRWIHAAKNRQGEASRVYALQSRDAEEQRKVVLAEVTTAIHYLDTAREMLVAAQLSLMPVPAEEGL